MNDQDNILISSAEDKLRLCNTNGMLTNTRFLDIRQQSVLFSRFKGERDCRALFFGGFEQAERKLLIFVPDYYGIESAEELTAFLKENEELCPLAALRLKKDRFSGTLTHRDYLGAVMALGVKRETVGDIIVGGDGCFLFAESTVVRYLLDNLSSAGRATLQAERISLSQIDVPEERFVTEVHTVASLRLDAVLCQAFSLSRTRAAEAVEKGLVYVNGEQIFKADRKIMEKDKLVIRGKGKAVFSEISGESKKGRIIIRLNRYL